MFKFDLSTCFMFYPLLYWLSSRLFRSEYLRQANPFIQGREDVKQQRQILLSKFNTVIKK